MEKKFIAKVLIFSLLCFVFVACSGGGLGSVDRTNPEAMTKAFIDDMKKKDFKNVKRFMSDSEWKDIESEVKHMNSLAGAFGGGKSYSVEDYIREHLWKPQAGDAKIKEVAIKRVVKDDRRYNSCLQIILDSGVTIPGAVRMRLRDDGKYSVDVKTPYSFLYAACDY